MQYYPKIKFLGTKNWDISMTSWLARRPERAIPPDMRFILSKDFSHKLRTKILKAYVDNSLSPLR